MAAFGGATDSFGVALDGHHNGRNGLDICSAEPVIAEFEMIVNEVLKNRPLSIFIKKTVSLLNDTAFFMKIRRGPLFIFHFHFSFLHFH